MLTRGDMNVLEQQWAHLELAEQVVLSVITRFVACAHRPLCGLRRALVRGIIHCDQLAQRQAPFLNKYASVAYIELTRTH